MKKITFKPDLNSATYRLESILFVEKFPTEKERNDAAHLELANILQTIEMCRIPENEKQGFETSKKNDVKNQKNNHERER